MGVVGSLAIALVLSAPVSKGLWMFDHPLDKLLDTNTGLSVTLTCDARRCWVPPAETAASTSSQSLLRDIPKVTVQHRLELWSLLSVRGSSHGQQKASPGTPFRTPMPFVQALCRQTCPTPARSSPYQQAPIDVLGSSSSLDASGLPGGDMTKAPSCSMLSCLSCPPLLLSHHLG